MSEERNELYEINYIDFEKENEVYGVIKGFLGNKYGLVLVLENENKIFGVNVTKGIERLIRNAKSEGLNKGHKIKIRFLERAGQFMHFELEWNKKIFTTKITDLNQLSFSLS